MKRILVLSFVFAIAGLALAACGGTGTTPQGTAAQPQATPRAQLQQATPIIGVAPRQGPATSKQVAPNPGASSAPTPFGGCVDALYKEFMNGPYMRLGLKTGALTAFPASCGGTTKVTVIFSAVAGWRCRVFDTRNEDSIQTVLEPPQGQDVPEALGNKIVCDPK